MQYEDESDFGEPVEDIEGDYDFDLDEDVEDAPIDDVDEARAATRLQAARRGQQGRRSVNSRVEQRLAQEEQEEDNAALRMQAARRGQQGRREAKRRASAADNHPLARALAAEAEEEQASATRLQAVRRGQQARAEQRQRSAAAAKLQSARRGQQGRREVRSQRLELQLAQEEAEEDAAAVRMQAARRGQQARRAAQSRRPGANPTSRPTPSQPIIKRGALPVAAAAASAESGHVNAAEYRQLKADFASLKAEHGDLKGQLAEARQVSLGFGNEAAEATARLAEAERDARSQGMKADSAARESEQLRDRLTELQMRADALEQRAEAAERLQQQQGSAHGPTGGGPSARAHGGGGGGGSRLPAVPSSSASGQPSEVGRGPTKGEEKARRHAQAANERASSLEAVISGLTERLQESEASVRMLRAQLRKATQDKDPALRMAKNMHEGKPARRPGQSHAPAGTRLPRIGAGRAELIKEEERQQEALNKVREEGFVNAFPDYGGKTKSGLRGIGKQRISVAQEEMERKRNKQQEKKRREHLRALQEHGLSPSSRHERVLAHEAAAAMGLGA